MSLENLKQHTADIEKQAQELIEQAYQRGYKKAEEDYHIQSEKDRDSSYQCGYEYGIEQGRNQAWDAVRKIFNEFSGDELREVFGKETTLLNVTNYSASEAIKKIRAYEEQKKQEAEKIKVGDEILNKWGTKGIVIEIAPQFNGAIIYSVLWRNAERKCWDKSDWEDNCVWKKTGRHFPEIAEVLKKMQEDKE
jgi:hypothetical protein